MDSLPGSLRVEYIRSLLPHHLQPALTPLEACLDNKQKKKSRSIMDHCLAPLSYGRETQPCPLPKMWKLRNLTRLDGDGLPLVKVGLLVMDHHQKHLHPSFAVLTESEKLKNLTLFFAQCKSLDDRKGKSMDCYQQFLRLSLIVLTKSRSLENSTPSYAQGMKVEKPNSPLSLPSSHKVRKSISSL